MSGTVSSSTEPNTAVGTPAPNPAPPAPIPPAPPASERGPDAAPSTIDAAEPVAHSYPDENQGGPVEDVKTIAGGPSLEDRIAAVEDLFVRVVNFLHFHHPDAPELPPMVKAEPGLPVVEGESA